MRLLLFLFGLALGAESSTAMEANNCPMFWTNFRGCCYKYVFTHLNWADAEVRCMSEGAHLVSIHSLEEQKFVQQLMNSFGAHGAWIWSGFSDTRKEGRWLWSDGSAVDFTFWAAGEPNDQYGKEDCAHLNFGAKAKWNDRPCDSAYGFVCKKKA